MRCSICGFRIRGKKHITGNNHIHLKRAKGVPKLRKNFDGKIIKRTEA